MPPRSQTFHGSKSFSRMDDTASDPLDRSRFKPLEISAKPESINSKDFNVSTKLNDGKLRSDIYENKPASGVPDLSSENVAEDPAKEQPQGFDDLPIELASLTDRFVESLTAKVYPEPPTVEKLSDMFQEFYLKAESHIAIHINSLSVKQFRETSPTRSIALKNPGNRMRSKSIKENNGSLNKGAPEQQMLTPQEIADRRKARRLLEQKRVALEEAIERRTCERVYKRIWRHRSTLDEVRDEKLRSRTAALALVGIGLKDLGISLGDPSKESGGLHEEESHVEELFSTARNELLRMNEAHYPLGKLQHLAAAHKSIVDLLFDLHQSSSSADDILPSLIYALITTPPEGINIISNLLFTQRFRAASKIDGEAAYCLTNLEAAVTFLETVDLASLRSDEPLEGPPKVSSRPSTPQKDFGTECAARTPHPLPRSASNTMPPGPIPAQAPLSNTLQSPSSPEGTPPTSPSRQRRLSHLFQPPASAFGAASDAVRLTADNGIKNISSTLDNSFRFLFGRLKEQHIAVNDDNPDGSVLLPRTLDDARKLIDPKPANNDDGDTSGASSIVEKPDPRSESSLKLDEKLLGMFAGRKQHRDSSVDSLHSSGSGGKKVAFAREAEGVKAKAASTNDLTASSPVQQDPVQTLTAVESMRNLGNTLNPLNRIAGMSVIRGFGKHSSGSTPTLATAPPPNKVSAEVKDNTSNGTKLSTGVNSAQPTLPTLVPPIKRFLDTSDVGELKVSELAELLKDYKRLADALKSEGRFEI
ncbi:MAG: hypothetical protein LQ342_002374 [Letrouitia transgressa]|nr:MAG: hypothetical protein LQ342_002374 [Letrouitia transgressa]